MTITRWEPLRDIERLFDEDLLPVRLPRFGFDLAVDLFEKDDDLIATMAIAGVDPEKLDITIEGDHLRICGTREEEKETKEKNYYSKEIHRGSFERMIRLPSAIDADKAEAEYADGVLRIVMHKKETTKANTVRVKTKAVK